MIREKDILNEKKCKILRQISKEVTFPMEKSDITLMNDMINHLRLSQDEEYAKKHNIRAGMGLAAVQLGVLKRYFVISYKKDDGTFEEYKIINPQIVSESEEKIYIEEGEGCLSVSEDVDGIVPRASRITITYFDENANKITKRFREEMSVAVQHEIDHLNGIIYIDKIDKNNPYKDIDNLRAI